MLTMTATLETEDKTILVRATWSRSDGQLDRTEGMGWRLNDTAANRKLAARLMKAVDAQKALSNPTILTDVNGRTYVSCNINVTGRHMNADLKRLGF